MNYTCLRCGYTWAARTDDPARCPRCKSTRWNRKVIIDTCLRCGARWVQRNDEVPKYCPTCHSSMWNTKKNVYTCPKCGRTRILRSNSRIEQCPYCDIYNEHKQRKRNYSTGNRGICKMIHLWGDGNGLALYYLKNGSGSARLYLKGKLIGEMNIENWCKEQGIRFSTDAPSGKTSQVCEEIVKLILDSSEIPPERIQDISALRKVDAASAKILALYEKGMNSALIALKLGIPFSKIQELLSNIPPVVRGSELHINDAKNTPLPENGHTEAEAEATRELLDS